MEFLNFVVFINLEKRKDRLAEISKEMDKMQIQATRFNAVEKNTGIVGCGLSHLAVLKLAKDNNWPHVLILEDDFTFLVDKPKFQTEMKSLVDYSTRHQFDVC